MNDLRNFNPDKNLNNFLFVIVYQTISTKKIGQIFFPLITISLPSLAQPPMISNFQWARNVFRGLTIFVGELFCVLLFPEYSSFVVKNPLILWYCKSFPSFDTKQSIFLLQYMYSLKKQNVFEVWDWSRNWVRDWIVCAIEGIEASAKPGPPLNP